ncbi:MAG: hypothetical protein R6U10_02615, partial [Thermoplasmatota archaeon]
MAPCRHAHDERAGAIGSSLSPGRVFPHRMVSGGSCRRPQPRMLSLENPERKINTKNYIIRRDYMQHKPFKNSYAVEIVRETMLSRRDIEMENTTSYRGGTA